MKGDANSFARCLGVVLLAAGGSRRMERPKLLLPWGGTSIAGHQIRVWDGLGANAGRPASSAPGDSAGVAGVCRNTTGQGLPTPPPRSFSPPRARAKKGFPATRNHPGNDAQRLFGDAAG